MVIACISDTHGIWLPPIPDEADIVIHAGDVTRGPKTASIMWMELEFAQWAKTVDRPIYLTWGNHDYIDWPQPFPGGLVLPDNVQICADEAVTIVGTQFWFSPWSPVFGDWAWMDTESELRKKYTKIPEDTQVIVSHGPPKYYGDCLNDARFGPPTHVGSTPLLERFMALPEADLLICGHIHSGWGRFTTVDGYVYHGGTNYTPTKAGKLVVNAAQVDEDYKPVHNAVQLVVV